MRYQVFIKWISISLFLIGLITVISYRRLLRDNDNVLRIT